jgi:hypothetical protein
MFQFWMLQSTSGFSCSWKYYDMVGIEHFVDDFSGMNVLYEPA